MKISTPDISANDFNLLIDSNKYTSNEEYSLDNIYNADSKTIDNIDAFISTVDQLRGLDISSVLSSINYTKSQLFLNNLEALSTQMGLYSAASNMAEDLIDFASDTFLGGILSKENYTITKHDRNFIEKIGNNLFSYYPNSKGSYFDKLTDDQFYKLENSFNDNIYQYLSKSHTDIIKSYFNINQSRFNNYEKYNEIYVGDSSNYFKELNGSYSQQLNEKVGIYQENKFNQDSEYSYINIKPNITVNGDKGIKNSVLSIKRIPQLIPNKDNKHVSFSIENLAVEVVKEDDNGYYTDIYNRKYLIPLNEVGINDGRVMWFIPYNLKINESTSSTFNKEFMMGRNESVPNYQHSERSMTISFSLLIDHENHTEQIIVNPILPIESTSQTSELNSNEESYKKTVYFKNDSYEQLITENNDDFNIEGILNEIKNLNNIDIIIIKGSASNFYEIDQSRIEYNRELAKRRAKFIENKIKSVINRGIFQIEIEDIENFTQSTANDIDDLDIIKQRFVEITVIYNQNEDTEEEIVEEGQTENIDNNEQNLENVKEVYSKYLDNVSKYGEKLHGEYISNTGINTFSLAYRSQTPNDFHYRLTFLQQCLRQGNAVNVNDNNIYNSVFGRQPIVVIRIGDFINSKAIIENLTIDYSDVTWDMNMEGRGLQPMFANVTLQVTLYGGQAMNAPVNEIQNAVSNNYYANSSYYE